MKEPVICAAHDSSVTAGAVEVARDLAQRHQLPLIHAHMTVRFGPRDAARRVA